MKRILLISVALSASLLGPSLLAQDADTNLVKAKILTGDAAFSTHQALAVRDGKIAAVGTTAQIRKLGGARAKVIDLGGRTVIPGLIDSHMHAIRAALFFASETNFSAKRSTDSVSRRKPSRQANGSSLEEVIEQRGKPEAIRCDNGPELTSRHFLSWCEERKIQLLHILNGPSTR